MAIQWSVPAWSWPLLLVVAAGAVVYTVAMYRRTGPDPGRRLRRVLVGLRGTALALLVLAIAGPATSCLRTRVQPAELLLVVEDSGSMALAAGAGDGDDSGAARWDLALAALAHVDSTLATTHPGVTRTWLRGNGLQPLQEFGLHDGPPVPPPTRHGTSLAGLARRLRERVAGRPVRAVVLVSDGAETGQPAGGAALANAAAALPLRVLGVGPGNDLPDRALVDVRHAESAYAGQDVRVEFTVAQSPPAAAGDVVVTLRDPDGVVAADTLAFAGPVSPGALTFRPRREGLLPLVLQVSPLANERFLGNNEASFVVDVRRDRLQVLVVAGTPGWDARFLAVAAAAEPRLALTVAYPAAGGLVLADSLQPWQPPRTAAEWAAWNAVVLTGWGARDAALDWSALGAAVDGGLGLLVLPSAAGPAGAALAAPPPAPLAALLPVEVAPWHWQAGPRFAATTAAGARHSVLDGVTDGPGGSALSALPPWREIVRAAPRPGATVLLDAVAAGGTAGLPALVTAPRGQGRVAWFGARHVWEWAFWELPGGPGTSAEQPARRVLRNLLVWLAGGDGSGGLGFASRPGAWQEGQPVRVAARWRDLRGEPVTDRLPRLELRPAGPGADSTASRTFEMVAVPGSPGDSQVELGVLPPGRYEARLGAPGEPPVAGATAELLVTDASIETAQVRQDRSRLEQLAARAGGSYRDLGRRGSLAELETELLALDWSGVEDRQRRRQDLSAGWPFIVVVTLLLGAEWLLRRRHGLL